MRAAILATLLALATFGPGVAKPVPNVFDHKDWIGVCDNVLRCTAMGLAPDGQDRAYIAVVREGGGAAAATLSVVIYSDDALPGGPVKLRAPGFDLTLQGRWNDDQITAETKDPAAVAAFARLAASDAKAVQVSTGKISVPLSLEGAAATLAWADDRQGRVGGVTALLKKGTKPAAAVPAPPPIPVYSPAPAGSAAEVKPVVFPKGLTARPDLKDCDHEQMDQADERGAWRLGPNVMLWSVPCRLGAYNLNSYFFISDAKGGGVRPAPIPLIPSPDSADPEADPPYSMINADFDPKTMTLSAFEKGRGLGDCGMLRNFVWDGKAFQPTEIDYMPECRGVTPEAWPALYRARTK